MKKKIGRMALPLLALTVWMSSCQISNAELGEDLLPPGDSVFLFHDTIFDIQAYPVVSPAMKTSEYNLDATRQYLAGALYDTITGSSRASLVTQFNYSSVFKAAPNTEIDTIMFFLHVDDYIGVVDQEVTFRVYEFLEGLRIDTFYYSDYDPTGRYNPVPLAELTTLPAADTVHEFLITDQEFIDKFLAISGDTNYFRNDSIFKDYFHGLYITCDPASDDGSMARMAMNSTYTRLSLHYANDSTDVDSTAERDFRWVHFPINEYSSQKVNVFDHDFTGTYVSTVLEDEEARVPWLYVQGMAGVNTKFSFSSLAEWMARSPVAIASAKLVLDVVPEEVSGLPLSHLPGRLTLAAMADDGSLDGLQDPVVLMANYQGSFNQFGGFLSASSGGLFMDTTYHYTFNMPLHFQAMLDGSAENTPFLLQLDGPLVNPHKVKLWGNLLSTEPRIRLEVVYLKL